METQHHLHFIQACEGPQSYPSSMGELDRKSAEQQFCSLPSFLQLTQDLQNNSSITDSDSVASFSESEQGSQQSSSSFTSKSRSLTTNNKDSVEVRAVHNVSEQYRRKYLKSCFDNLQKEVVSDGTAKASHLLILTSALEVVNVIKEQESQNRRDQERLLEEQRQLLRHFDELVRELVRNDPSFDVNQILAQCDLGIQQNFLNTADRQDPFQIEETVEVIGASQSRKRCVTDLADDQEFGGASRTAPSSSKRNGKKGSKSKNSELELTVLDVVDSPGGILNGELAKSNGGPTVQENAKIQRLVLRFIDEPDDAWGDPDSPAPVVKSMETSRQVLTMSDRKKIASERGIPLHLADGVPTLPGGNYWSQSLCAFPMHHRQSYPTFPQRNYEMPLDTSRSLIERPREVLRSVISRLN